MYRQNCWKVTQKDQDWQQSGILFYFAFPQSNLIWNSIEGKFSHQRHLLLSTTTTTKTSPTTAVIDQSHLSAPVPTIKIKFRPNNSWWRNRNFPSVIVFYFDDENGDVDDNNVVDVDGDVDDDVDDDEDDDDRLMEGISFRRSVAINDSEKSSLMVSSCHCFANFDLWQHFCSKGFVKLSAVDSWLLAVGCWLLAAVGIVLVHF